MQRAYAVLTDPFLRHHYDRYGHYGLNIAEHLRSYDLVNEKKDSGTPFNLAELEHFNDRVRRSQGLLDELTYSRMRSAESRLKFGVFCLGLNPFYAHRPALHTLSSWRCSDLSVRHAVALTSPQSLVHCTFAYVLGRRWTLKETSRETAYEPQQLSKLSLRRLLFSRSALSVAFPLTNATSATVETIAEGSGPSGRCDVSLRRSLGHDASALVRYSVERGVAKESIMKHSTHLECLFPLSLDSRFTGLLSYSLSSGTSIVSATVALAELAFGDRITGTVQLSNAEAVLENEYCSAFFSGLRRYYKGESSREISPSTSPVLPDVEMATFDQARVTFRTTVGSLSGIQLVCQYTVPLHWIDPFCTLHYSIKWHPHYGWLSAEVRLQRLSNSFELPVVFAWPLRGGSTTDLVNAGGTSQRSVWYKALLFVLTPILLHRLWADVLNGRPTLERWWVRWKEFYSRSNKLGYSLLHTLLARLAILRLCQPFIDVSIPNRKAAEQNDLFITLHRDFLKTFSFSRSSTPYLLLSVFPRTTLLDTAVFVERTLSLCKPAAAVAKALREQFQLEKLADAIEAKERAVEGLVIEDAIYGIDSVIHSIVINECPTEAPTPEDPVAQRSPLAVHPSFSSPCTNVQSSSNTIPTFSVPSFNVKIPLQAAVRKSRLIIRGGVSYGTLPAFCPAYKCGEQKPETVMTQLYIRYRYAGRSHVRVFHDSEPITVP